jgi:hypothetical protein
LCGTFTDNKSANSISLIKRFVKENFKGLI